VAIVTRRTELIQVFKLPANQQQRKELVADIWSFRQYINGGVAGLPPAALLECMSLNLDHEVTGVGNTG